MVAATSSQGGLGIQGAENSAGATVGLSEREPSLPALHLGTLARAGLNLQRANACSLETVAWGFRG